MTSTATEIDLETSERERARPSWFFITLVCFLCGFGLFMRFSSYEKPMFVYDEAHTLMYASGYSVGEITDQISNKKTTFGDLRKRFQVPTKDYGWRRCTESLWRDVHGKAPAMTLLTRWWTFLVGTSVSSLRLLPLLLSLLQLPAAYWFGYQLSKSYKCGLLAMSLISISPFALAWSQDLQEYSLLTALICLSSAAFLNACGSGSWRAWLFYNLLMILSFYCSSLILPTYIAHIIYLLLIRTERIIFRMKHVLVSKNLAFMLVGFVFLGALCSPLLFQHLYHGNFSLLAIQSVGDSVRLDVLVEAWLTNPLAFFLDIRENSSLKNILLSGLIIILVCSVAVLWMHGRKKSLVFLVVLFLTSAAFFWLPDLFFGGQRSLITRYWMGAPIAVLLLVSYALSLQFSTRMLGLRRLGPLVAGFVIFSQGYSCYKLLQIQQRDRVYGQDLLSVASEINKHSPCLLVTLHQTSGTNFGQMLALCHSVEPNNEVLLIDDTDPASRLRTEKHFYLFNSDGSTIARLAEFGYRVKRINNYKYMVECTLAKEPAEEEQKAVDSE